jgi:adenylate cyclase
MISRDDLLNETAEIPMPQGETAQQLQRVALSDITSNNDTRTPEMAGVIPAITKLMVNAKSAGIVNASPDRDGIRRRIHLLSKLHGNYYGNLTLVGMSEFLGNPSITVNNNHITLENAIVNGKQTTIRIPRTKDGSILLKWPKKSFYDYHLNSLLEFIRHTNIEPHLAQNLSLMASAGFFSFYDGEYSPYDLYTAAEMLKEDLLNTYNDSLSEEWLLYRKMFFETAEHYLTGGCEETILAAVAGDSEIEEYVKELFDACRTNFFRLKEIRQNAAYINNSFCVIGSDATSMTDNGTTPIQENYTLVGTYAVIANMILSGEFLSEAPLFISVIIALIFSFAVVFAAKHLKTGKSLVTGISSLVILSIGLWIYFYLTKQYIASAVPIVSTALSFITITIIDFLASNKEKAFLHSAFSRYISPEVIKDIINDPSKLNLGGEKREMTAIFTDIQGFSTFSEKLDPTQLVALLNKYLTRMSNIIMENSGIVDKYEGDAIIAFWGAPLKTENHAALACRSALAMKKAEKELNKIFAEENLCPVPIFTRIGINTGDMVVGNMGAENKMDYTIMGNAVNLAARLEGVNKQYHTGGILISEYTREQAGDEFLSRRLDRVRVVGVNTPLRLYELLALKTEASPELINRLIEWDKAIEHYETQNFETAMKSFAALYTQLPDDNVAKLYTIRSTNYITTPPPADWDGVNNLTEK